VLRHRAGANIDLWLAAYESQNQDEFFKDSWNYASEDRNNLLRTIIRGFLVSQPPPPVAPHCHYEDYAQSLWGRR